MNASLSDGNEPVIDIFILSANSPLSTQLEKQLRDEGYYVTVFSEGAELLETLRNGMPNLLMCDTTVPEADAFEVCRQIKADDYFWKIPVLIISGASDLGDLLRVLDCNADNFIAHPFDPPYLLSLIEGMLTTPVERQTPEQIKTQFKIKHDDRIFVVTADRRKLLEFLLSSFEIAVNKSADLARALDDKEHLGTTIRNLEETVLENTKVIGIINDNLKTKEQKLAEHAAKLTDREQTVREKISEIDRLTGELSAEKAALEEAREEIQQTQKEKDESQAAHQATIDQLQRQVSEQSSELDMLRPSLESTRAELAQESARRKEFESELSVTTDKKEQAEKALYALTTEYEQLKITFGTEKNRADDAENELRSVLQAKTQSEQDLTEIINDLKNTAKEQAAALSRLKEESESEIARLKEESTTELSRQKAESESAFARLKEESSTELSRLKEESESEIARLKEESSAELSRQKAESESAFARLKEESSAELSRQKAESESAFARLKEESSTELSRLKEESESAYARLKEESGSEIARLTQELGSESARLRQAEETLNSLTAAKTQSEATLQATIDERANLQGSLDAASARLEETVREAAAMRDEISALRSAKESAEQELMSVKSSLDETAASREADLQKIASQKEDLVRVYEEKEKAESLAESLSGSLREIKAELEQERNRASDSKERMKVLLMERDRELADLRTAHAESRTALSSHTTAVAEMKHDLDSALAAKKELESELQREKDKVFQIERELETIAEGRASEKERHAALVEELDQLKTSLEHETLRRQETEDQLRDTLSQQQHMEQDLDRLVAESKSLHSELDTEHRMHEEARKHLRSLEERVSSLNREKTEAEKTAMDLTAEIDQARQVALSDEWDGSPKESSRLLDATKNIQKPAPVPFSGVKREAEIIKKRSLIVKVPTMPHEIRPLPRTMVTIDPVREKEPEISQIHSVEDLYEDDDNEKGRVPKVSIVREPDTEPVTDVLPDTLPQGEHGGFFEDTARSGSGSEAEDEEADDGLEPEEYPEGSGPQNIAFNRNQWLDLLKWSHHCDALEPEQRMQIVRMGRLIQKGRRLTKKQEEQVLEMVALVQRLGYRIH